MTAKMPRTRPARGADAGSLISALRPGAIADELGEHGIALTGPILTSAECASLIAAYEDPALYRSHIRMERHGFGRGEYKYFNRPLPSLIAGLRSMLYRTLAPIANAWSAALKLPQSFPADHDDYIALCHKAGQTKPTPLILKYRQGDYNCLHQDLYGDLVFPFQAAFLLSEPDRDFEGGEFVITEQRPRMQSRAEVVPLRQGEGVIFPVRHRPVQGKRGTYRTVIKHGVSRVRIGERFTLGIIFHDAG